MSRHAGLRFERNKDRANRPFMRAWQPFENRFSLRTEFDAEVIRKAPEGPRRPNLRAGVGLGDDQVEVFLPLRLEVPQRVIYAENHSPA